MKTRTLHPLLLLLLVAPALTGWIAKEPLRAHFTDTSRIYIDGTSSMHDWSCEVSEIDGFVELQRAQDGSVTVAAATAAVPVTGIECKNGKMNGKLRKALNADEHPTIEYRLVSARSSAPTSEGRVAVTTNGKLTVAGVERDIEMTVVLSITADGRRRIEGSVPLLMSDFDVKPPSAMLGILTTGDAMTVRLEVETRAESSIQAASHGATLAQ